MSKLLKGNYRRLKRRGRLMAKTTAAPKDLTQEFEESVLAKLGGSLCFVMKRGHFIWTDPSTAPDRTASAEDTASADDPAGEKAG